MSSNPLSLRSLFVAPLALALVLGSAMSAGLEGRAQAAPQKDKDGWYDTGSGIRKKSVAFVKVDVYEVHHYMKEIPPSKSREAAINLDIDKRIQFRMLRDVGHEKMANAMKDGFEMNGYKDEAKIAKFTSAYSKDVTEGAKVTITYDSTAKSTTITVDGAGSATIEGADFMKAVWSIWFGKMDQEDLGTQMLKNL